MSRTTLNLSVDAEAVERARKYSEQHDTSISKLVNDFLARLPVADEHRPSSSLPPVTRRLNGIAKGGPDEEDYHRYLLEKYGQ